MVKELGTQIAERERHGVPRRRPMRGRRLDHIQRGMFWRLGDASGGCSHAIDV